MQEKIDAGQTSGLGGSPGVGYDNPLQYSCLENPMDGSLAVYSPQGRKESDMTDVTQYLAQRLESEGENLRKERSTLGELRILCVNSTRISGWPLKYACMVEGNPDAERIGQILAVGHHGANRIWTLSFPRYFPAKTNKQIISTLQRNVTYSLQESGRKTK